MLQEEVELSFYRGYPLAKHKVSFLFAGLSIREPYFSCVLKKHIIY